MKTMFGLRAAEERTLEERRITRLKRFFFMVGSYFLIGWMPLK
jgi:hypothetical protein